MIDASHEPFEENVAVMKRVVKRAHVKGVSVETELGRLGGVEEDVQVDEDSAFLKGPKEAVEFVGETGCDSLAAAIGTSHGPARTNLECTEKYPFNLVSPPETGKPDGVTNDQGKWTS